MTAEEMAHRGQRAKEILADPIFKDSLEMLRTRARRAIEESETPEACWYAKSRFVALQQVTAEIQLVMQLGQVAEQVLAARAEDERKSTEVAPAWDPSVYQREAERARQEWLESERLRNEGETA